MPIFRNLVCIIMLLPFSLKAQVDRTNIKAYYSLINRAELAIIDTNYNLAHKDYQDAFKLKYPNGKDLYNAFLVDYYRKDSTYAKKYLNELAYKGMDREMFLDTARYYPFYKYISSEYDSIYDSGSKTKMAKLGMELIAIFQRDQAVRQKALEDPNGLNESDYKKMAKVDSANIERLKNYIKTNGFPSFEQIGFWDNSRLAVAGPLWFVLWHCRPNATAIDDIMKEAVLNGEFRPDDWGSVIMERTDASKYNEHMKLWKMEPIISKDEEKKIDSSRALIYLESLSDFKRKFNATQETVERIRTEYNPNLYPSNMRYNRIFIYLNAFLVPTKDQIAAGVQ